MMQSSLVAKLLSDANLEALVGNRIFWKTLEPSGEFPRIVMHTVSSNRDYKMSGPTGLVKSRVQIDCWARTYASAQAVKAAVENLLSGYKGTHSTTTFDGIFLDTERDVFDESDTPEDLLGVSLDFIIWHKET